MTERIQPKPGYLAPKKDWPPGPWNDEPDRLDFRFNGLPCILSRGTSGAWCGYVGVPPGHPWHGQPYDDIRPSVHGGLTYAAKCRGLVCHVPEPGESPDVWWLGFDCAHAFDFGPALAALAKFPEYWAIHDKYWTIDEAKAETEHLAAQAIAAAQ